MREIEIMATETGAHFLLFGFNASELATFSIQFYIEKHGARAVDWLTSLSLSFCSFMGGNVYLHNSNDVPRCTLFGEKKDMKVGIVVNEQASLVKIFDSLGIHTDGTWEVESLVIPADQNHPNGMTSLIPKSFFKKREGILYSEFLRNTKTSGSTIKSIEAMTGEQLRGKVCYLVLKNTSADKVELWEVDVNLTKSR